VYKDATIFEFRVPYVGDPKLLQYSPSHYTLNPPLGEIYQSYIGVEYPRTDLDGTEEEIVQNVQSSFQANLANIRQYLIWMREDVSKYQLELENVARARLAERKQLLERRERMASSLPYPPPVSAVKQQHVHEEIVTKMADTQDENTKALDELLALEDNEVNTKLLIQQMQARQGVIPFVGAGFSKGAGFPLWEQFLTNQAERARCTEQVRQLLDDLKYEEAAELLLDKRGYRAFHDAVRDAYSPDRMDSKYVIGAVTLLPQLARGPVLTTNFDYVLEFVFEQASVRFTGVVWGAKAGILTEALNLDGRYLFKLHGDALDETDRVLTRADYQKHYGDFENSGVDMTLSLPKVLHQVFLRPVLFLGCGLQQDRTMRVLENISAQFRSIGPFAILEAPENLDDLPSRARWLSERNIRPIWYPHGRHDMIEILLRHLLCKAATTNPL
jgi:hypothetical protein